MKPATAKAKGREIIHSLSPDSPDDETWCVCGYEWNNVEERCTSPHDD